MLDSPTKFDFYRAAETAIAHDDYNQAMQFYMQALRLSLAMSHNEPSLDVAETHHRIANLFRSVGQYSDADPHYSAAFSMYFGLVGELDKRYKQVQQDWSVQLTLVAFYARRRAASTN
jgi:tetratricopeptide (TPR) repeat protein